MWENVLAFIVAFEHTAPKRKCDYTINYMIPLGTARKDRAESPNARSFLLFIHL